MVRKNSLLPSHSSAIVESHPMLKLSSNTDKFKVNSAKKVSAIVFVGILGI